MNKLKEQLEKIVKENKFPSTPINKNYVYFSCRIDYDYNDTNRKISFRKPNTEYYPFYYDLTKKEFIIDKYYESRDFEDDISKRDDFISLDMKNCEYNEEYILNWFVFYLLDYSILGNEFEQVVFTTKDLKYNFELTNKKTKEKFYYQPIEIWASSEHIYPDVSVIISFKQLNNTEISSRGGNHEFI